MKFLDTLSPLKRAALSILALALIVLLANWAMRLTPLGNTGIDLTERKIHTLSDGTRQILSELDAPVIIRYYASRSSEGVPSRFENYMKKVDDFLQQYKSIAGKELQVEYYDPEPDTDEEDSANLDGVAGQRLNEYDNFYFGLSISCLDKKAVIPFLNPEDETLLEYQLSSKIAEVSQVNKPIVGVMSPLKLAGDPMAMMQQRSGAGQPWVIHQQLKQSYDVRDIPFNSEVPEDVTTLVLVHPAGITRDGEYQIDRFVQRGGKLIALLDADSVSVAMSGNVNPQSPQTTPRASGLPRLLANWGISFTGDRCVADGQYRRPMGDGRFADALLNITPAAFTSEDDLITSTINDLYLVLPGGFKNESVEGITYDAMVQSSDRTGLVNADKASNLEQGLLANSKTKGDVYDFLVRLQGKFPTAFPDGDPSAPKEEKADSEEEETPEPEAIETAVFLISDVDFIYDRFAYTEGNSFGGMRVVQPTTGNSALFMNIVDQAAGSVHLVGSRSRASTRRPFTVIKDMKADFEQRVGEKIAEFDEKRRDAERRLTNLQAQRSASNNVFLSDEQEAELTSIREEQVEYSKKIREFQKELKTRIDYLEGKIIQQNVFLVPIVVALIGVLVFFIRRSRTRAI